MHKNRLVDYCLLILLLGLWGKVAGQSEVTVLVRVGESLAYLKNDKTREDSMVTLNMRNSEIRDVIDGFRKYTQGRVYYFFDSDTKKVMSGDFSNVFIDTVSLQRDSSIRLGVGQDYVIAEFATYMSGSTSPFGLVVYDKEMNYKKKPFPYFTSDVYGLFTYQDVVIRFNRRLKKYLEKKGGL